MHKNFHKQEEERHRYDEQHCIEHLVSKGCLLLFMHNVRSSRTGEFLQDTRLIDDAPLLFLR